ncbi:MAG: hypothetical protein AAF544_03530 [Bacteroidota bacterium]
MTQNCQFRLDFARWKAVEIGDKSPFGLPQVESCVECVGFPLLFNRLYTV